ncbi:host cell division inhibitor Icd-like protein [Escherichia coli]|uniref:host cell division inhibitor Icd-like protein n=1 Tax=Escherichia coli TaxID=562 RepID=UPI00191C7B6D|nr:host cell division inhibitor Icd-like protein [Escherichia coli]MCN3042220.1 host cell division inhibitor Icd-like protein [Escherichia coli]HBL6906555.1 host cell division inhibitor Icd-like protein [Escherichia coli]HBL6921303.1 host cell division inhibitor Icd-like protein [Escherichia coli]
MNMPDILKPAVRYIDTADKFALLNINHADYMRHIVSHFAAERMKHVKQYLEEVLSNYRAGGPVRREYPHDAGMTGKTKATTEGSPVEIKEIKRITNYAMSVAGGQGYQPGGRFLVAFSRRGYLSRNASSASRFGLVRGEGLSKDSRFWRAFSRWRSIMDNAIACNSSLVIVCTRKAVRCSTSYHSAGIFYGCNLRDDSGRFATYCININNVMLLCAFKENAGIFRTNFSRNTSDHLSKKAAYTEAIPYKTGIGRRNPFNQYKATQARPASFFVSFHRATIPSGKARTVSMVALVGQPKGWPVSLYAGIPTPASVTALYERRNSSGDSLKQYKEAFHMAVSARPYFVWRFMQCLTDSIAIFTVTAATEHEARAQLPHAHLVFVARIRQEVTHA